MTDRFNEIETELRMALDARAHEIEVPAELAERTLEAARKSSPRTLVERASAWRDGRRSKFPVTGYPRPRYVAGAVAAAIALFLVGFVVTMPDERGPKRAAGAASQSRTRASGDAVAGQVAGVVSSSNASVDATNRSDHVDVKSGDADASNAASSFTGLTAGVSQAVGAAGGSYLPPRLVRSADITIAVQNFDRGWSDAYDIASRFNGAIIDTKTRQVGKQIATGTVTMRIPSLKLEPALDALRDLGTLARLDTTGDDIAEQLNDVKLRVKSAKNKAEHLLELDKRAGTVSDSLEVRRQLGAAEKRVDSLEKQQKSIEDQVDFATIRATIEQSATVSDDDGIVLDAFDTSARIALTILAGILVMLGALLPLATLAFAIWFALRAFRKRVGRTG